MVDQIKPAIVPNFDTMPPELKALNRWVCWAYVDGKKVPKAPWLGRGKYAKSTVPATWGTFEQARAAYEGGGFSGVGVVLNNDGLVGVDLDHCITDGVIQPGALALLDGMGAAYVDITPSGTGLRAFGYGAAIETGVKGTVDGVSTELYSNERYLTLTGQIVKAGPLCDLHGFGDLAKTIKRGTKGSKDTGTADDLSTAEKQTRWIDALMSGETYHDSLRDLAASYVGQGLPGASVEVLLYGLMDAAKQREGWTARRAQIPELVASAVAKFGTTGFDDLIEQAKAQPEPRYKLLKSADIAQLPSIEWCVHGVLPTTGLAAGYGPSGSGKSFLFFDMAAAIATGAPWFNCRVVARPVVYLVLEGEGGIKQRVQAWERHHGRAVPDGMSVVTQPFTLTEKQDLADLAAVVPAGAVVVVDTLNRAAPTTDENSSRDMGEILQACKMLQAETGGVVLLVHHTGKDATKGLRGHSSLFAAMDAAVEVSRDGDRREWRCAKSKDSHDGVCRSFTLESMPVGVDRYGDAETSCIVVPTFDQVVTRKPLSPALQLAMTAFHAADVFGDGVTRDDWRDELYARMGDAEPETKRKAMQRAVKELGELREIERDGALFREPLF